MNIHFFDDYPLPIKNRAEDNLLKLVHIALEEDGEDLTSNGSFEKSHISQAIIIAKEDSYAVGLPLIDMVFECLEEKNYTVNVHVEEGSFVNAQTKLCTILAPTRSLLKAERVILNFITHLSGVANATSYYVKELEGTGVNLLDTRKTLPGLRYLEKYAVTCAGGKNHRLALDDMLMLKDNHIDAVGGITQAVNLLREKYSPCPPIEVECRTIEDVKEAVLVKPERIMLDNMSPQMIKEALGYIPHAIEAEISGNVSLETIRDLALITAETAPPRKADFISVGKITHSVQTADFSLRYINE